ncbi:putative ABC transport system ATP-binding protein [Caldalkalibacillus uzonensis]|uniref:ABC transport system ATP-binding protein n=1 Tax=Caldalkalibacillus uzonensis TaxID=353224 RepID=A0ABU0CVP1_9BACI|nr:ABC transporter ATP-binding protein [Caldalkalibacillus uzonensis]MDQ0340491.1 putative ABC transport system ATP-binding protein [Caldalkalibacillus uzonensis]
MFILKNIRYKDILHIKSLHIPPRRITCIIGESGSGKTTLFKLLNHMISPDEGEIEYKGQSVEDMDPIQLRRQVIMVPQEPVVFGETVKDDLLAGLRFAEQPEVDDKQLKAILAVVNLHKDLADSVQYLSGGEKQRLALARALLINPDVYLLDEPTSALDEQTEETVMERIIGHIKKQDKTLVIITHSSFVANQYGEYVLKLKDGDLSVIKG